MRTRCRATIEDLRQAIDCLPRHTRIAMLDGIAANDIRTPELAHRSGWAWTRVVRRYDEYERLMRRLEAARSEAPKASSPVPGR
jgi:hypothetical protein